MSSDTRTRRSASASVSTDAGEARVRPSRAEEGERRARRRDPSDHSQDLNLTLDESLLDRDQFEYRWAKNVKGRVSRLERQDWDRVEETADGSLGVVRHAGVGEQSEKYDLVLMRKYKDWHQSDRLEKQRQREEMMVRQDPIVTEEGGLNKAVSYKPKSAVEMSHERGPREN